MKELLDILEERGFVDQVTSPDLREHLKRPRSVYIGFDPTADSLHVGNLVGVMALVWFQKFGHTPYAIVGGATGKIGDPSGKSLERPLLDQKTLDHNIHSLSRFFHSVLPASQGEKPKILNNGEWLGSYYLIDFLRDVGKHFRIGSMLAKEAVKSRINSEEGMSFTEFSYLLLQSYDFHYLFEHYQVTLQMGGSDQWGNITAGIELQRKLKGNSLFGLTFPLLTRSDGKKFGKSEEGAIWLSAEKLSPYDFYQYFFRIPDADVVRLLKVLTFMDMEEIKEIESSMQQSEYIPNSAQKRLAEEVTRFIHGEEGLALARRMTQNIAPGADTILSKEALKALLTDLDPIDLSYHEVIGQKIVELALRSGLVLSKSDAVRLIKNGGLYLNNQKVTDPSTVVQNEDLIHESYLLLSFGKKKKILIKIDLQNIR